MSTLTHLSQTLQTVLGPVADALAFQTGFRKRASKISGSLFVQILSFSWLADPQARRTDFALTAAELGLTVTYQAVEQNLTESGATFLQQLLEMAIGQVVAAEPVALELLRRFSAVFIQDSSTITLPPALAHRWAGCGGNNSTSGKAALKLQVRLDLLSGALAGPSLQSGRSHDRNTSLLDKALPAGSLELMDLGYFSLSHFAKVAAQKAYWLSRWKVGTQLFDRQGCSLKLVKLLKRQQWLDLPVRVGAEAQLACRLVAAPVPQGVAAQRRAKVRELARRQQKPVSAEALTLAGWTIYLTNIAPEKLSGEEVLVMGRSRWQIELLFKLWKQAGEVDQWRSTKPWAILCEVYSKLLAMLMQHWLLVIGLWQQVDRSMSQGARAVRQRAMSIAGALRGEVGELVKVLERLEKVLAAGCRISKRRDRPATFQLFLAQNCGYDYITFD